jgi:hypothetical protein
MLKLGIGFIIVGLCVMLYGGYMSYKHHVIDHTEEIKK